MNKVKYILATAHLRLLYCSLIEPYLNYCCIVWASPEQNCLLETLHRLQKRAARITLFASYRAHSRPLFNKLNILHIYYLCLTQILIYVYKSVNHLLPSHSTNYFIRTKDIQSYATRGHEHNLHLITAQKTCRSNSLSFRGPKYWKTLPDYIRLASSLNKFKYRLKQYLLASS